MPPTITKVANVGDGLNVDVTLSGPPAGALTFKASRLPLDPAADAVVAVPQGGNVYRVPVRDGVTKLAIPVRLGYFVQARDDATLLKSYQYDRDLAGAEEVFEWVCKTDNTDWLAQCELAVLDILLDHYQALNRGMELHLGSTLWPSGAPVWVQKVHAGQPAFEEGGKYPQISLRTTEVQDDPYWANPRSDYLPIKTAITCYVCHQGEVNWEPLCRALGMAAFNVLNQTHFVEVGLACGLRMGECYALLGSSEEYYDEQADTYVASFTLNYQSKLLVGQEVL